MAQLLTNHQAKSISLISQREKEILHLISHGLTSKEIAKQLYISKETVSSHRRNLMYKWNAKNTAGLVRIGYETGVLPCLPVLT